MKFKKRNQRRLSTTQHLKRWIKFISFALLIGAIYWGFSQYNPSKILTVSVNWSIDNPNLVSQKELEIKIKPLVGEFHQLNLNEIKHELEQHPWVSNAQIKRLFLDAISINITTHQIVANWSNINCEQAKSDNCQGYITKQGKLITPDHLFYHQAENNSEKRIELQSSYDLDNSQLLFDDYQNHQQLLKNMTVERFVRSNIDTLHIRPNITVILGYNQQSLRLQRFIKIYAKLRTKIPLRKLNKATYDMRYPKGFTLKY